MAEWTRRSRNQFDNDGCKGNHGGIWAWRSVLVQGSISCTWCSQCDLQGAHRHYPLAADVWCDARCLSIPCIRVQGMVISTKTDEKMASIRHAQLRQSISDLNPTPAHIASLFRRTQFNDVESSKVWWIFVSIQEAENGWAVPVWQFNRHTV